MFYNSPTRINLTLPQSWNACTLPQLRAIANVMADCAARADRFHPFDMMEVKIKAFFVLTDLEIVEPLNPRVPVEEQYFVCRIRTPWLKKWWRKLTFYDDTFALYLWQIQSWLSPREIRINGKKTTRPGQLDWLNADGKQSLLRFPFPELKRKKHWYGRRTEFHGPNPFMDGFSWQRYRFAQDYMQFFVEQQNRVLKMEKMGKRVSPRDLLKAMKQLDLAKALFLATIFNRRVTHVDEASGRTMTDYHYLPNQHSDNSPWFRGFSDRDWQLVMLWWSGMMQFLHQTYPKVFKTQPVDPKHPKKKVNPLELYTRTTATLEKYLCTTAKEIEREPYTTILQQLEDITRQNEETEKMHKEFKSKRKK